MKHLCGMSNRLFNDQPLKKVIDEWLKNTGLKKKYGELEVLAAYRELMGPVISKHTTDLRLREKTLIIRLDSGALKEELSYSKSKIAQMINLKLGFPVVEQVEVW
jgi:predicted nucleic acid-binding Zn ribbon protein